MSPHGSSPGTPPLGAFDRPITEYMTRSIVSVTADDTVADADRLMRERHISCLIVVGKDGRATGVISRSDLLRSARAMVHAVGKHSLLELPTMCAGDLMTPRVLGVPATATVRDAARLMVDRRIHRVFVMDPDHKPEGRHDGARPIGVASTKDLMRAVLDAKLAAPIETFMSSPILSVQGSDTIADAVRELNRARVTGVVVLDGIQPIGVFTQSEALEARDLPAKTSVEQAMSQSLLCLPLATPLFRAAGFAMSTRARRVLATEDQHARGILTGLDFVRAILSASTSPVASTIANTIG